MGRHSAPDDDEDEAEILAAQLAAAATTAPLPTDVAARSPHGTNADLHLLRTSPALRARCIAAIVVPFALYVVLLVVIGHLGSFLLWVWVPTVLAGVLVGLFLDLAHRRSEASISGG